MAKSRRAFLREVASASDQTFGENAPSYPVTTLDRVSKNTGILRVGLLIAGNEDGAFSLIGGTNYGIQLFSQPGVQVFQVSPQAGGSLRIGKVGEPSITMTNGNVTVDGNIIAAGTVTASKISVGTLATVLLEDDKIEVGSWTGGKFSGFRATSAAVGGYNQDVLTWQVDSALGAIVAGVRASGNAYTIMGGTNKGIEMYDTAGTKVVDISPLNGGTMQLGAATKNHITMSNGSVNIDGDLLVNGSVEVTKLVVQEFVESLFYTDQIQVGEWDSLDRFSGFRINTDIVGGYKQDTLTWQVESSTGAIVSFDDDYPDYEYVKLDNTGLTLADFGVTGYPPNKTIAFRYSYQSGASIIKYPPIKVFSSGHTVVLYEDNSTGAPPAVSLESANTDIGSTYLAYGSLEFHMRMVDPDDPDIVYTNKLSLEANCAPAVSAKSNIYSKLALQIEAETPGVNIMLTGGRICLGGIVNLGRKRTWTSDAWVARPSSPSAGDMRFDPVNHRYEFYTGSKWQYFNSTDA